MKRCHWPRPATEKERTQQEGLKHARSVATMRVGDRELIDYNSYYRLECQKNALRSSLLSFAEDIETMAWEVPDHGTRTRMLKACKRARLLAG